MNRPFTHNGIDFVIKTSTEADGYFVRTYFLNGEPSNIRGLFISFEDSDRFKDQYGRPGVEQVLTDEQLYIEDGNYFGSSTYEF